MKNLFLLMAIVILIPSAISAQSNKNFSESFDFDKETTEEIVEIKVKPNTKSLTIEVKGHITEGSLYVKSINPNGKKSGNMSLLTSGHHMKHKIKMKGKNHNHDDSNYEVEIEEIREDEGAGEYEIETDEIRGGEDGEKDVRVIVKSGKNKDVTVTSKSKSNSNTNINITSGKGNGAKGNMVEKHSDPKAGTWKFVIKTEDATGNLSVKIKQD